MELSPTCGLKSQVGHGSMMPIPEAFALVYHANLDCKFLRAEVVSSDLVLCHKSSIAPDIGKRSNKYF